MHLMLQELCFRFISAAPVRRNAPPVGVIAPPSLQLLILRIRTRDYQPNVHMCTRIAWSCCQFRSDAFRFCGIRLIWLISVICCCISISDNWCSTTTRHWLMQIHISGRTGTETAMDHWQIWKYRNDWMMTRSPNLQNGVQTAKIDWMGTTFNGKDGERMDKPYWQSGIAFTFIEWGRAWWRHRDHILYGERKDIYKMTRLRLTAEIRVLMEAPRIETLNPLKRG